MDIVHARSTCPLQLQFQFVYTREWSIRNRTFQSFYARVMDVPIQIFSTSTTYTSLHSE